MNISGQRRAFLFAAIFVITFLLHARLLQLPYFWDEAGYYVPAARDILLTGSLIPHTTVSNAHPPLVMAWLALWWKLVGYATVVTRSAMLLVAAFTLFGLFRLAEAAANAEVAIAATLCTALYPVFFAQSSLAQVDLAAAGLIFWGLYAYLEGRPLATAAWFSAAVLAKETAILAPLALVAWEIAQLRFLRPNTGMAHQSQYDLCQRSVLQAVDKAAQTVGALAPVRTRRPAQFISLLFPLFPLGLWYSYHYLRTGYVFGNPEFFRYNVASTLNPLRFILTLALRLWQTLGYLHLWLLTLAMLLALLLPPVTDDGIERKRIRLSVQIVFFFVIVTYVLAMSLIGGAILARYMLPVIPLVIILAVSTLRRRVRGWPAAIALISLAFVAAWFWNPPYGFSPEDNLAYRDYITLHQDAERFLEARYPMAHVLTAWPASDELTRPWLGYVTRPMQVVRIEDFSPEQVISAADFRNHYQIALVFSTKYEPDHPILERLASSTPDATGWRASVFTRWQVLKRRFFGYHRDLPAEAAARVLGGHVVFSKERKSQWIAVIEMESGVVDASLQTGQRQTDAALFNNKFADNAWKVARSNVRRKNGLMTSPTIAAPSSAATDANVRPALLSIRSVAKSFGRHLVLRDISLEIATGEFLAILGESGSGKTTLLRIIAGFETATSGELWVESERLDGLPPYRRPVNTVFQNYALFPHLTVEENVAYSLRVGRRPAAEIAERVSEALAKVKMTSHAKKKPSQISGGQQQRVALARALVNRPKLLLLDEPLSALDANLRRQMQVELKSLQREVGITFVFVTHDQEEAMAIADRIALLRSGELEQVATPREIYNRPATAYVAQFIGHTNLLRGEITRGIAHSGELSWPTTLPDGPAQFSLRPEHIHLASPSNAPDAIRVRGRVIDQVFHGATELLRIQCASGLVLLARIASGSIPRGETDFEFSASNAVFVRDSLERL